MKVAAESRRNETLEQVVARVKGSIVRVETDRGLGSGVVVDAKGIVATNHHVMKGATQAQVIFASGMKLKVQGYVYCSLESDLCLLAVETPTFKLTALPVSDRLPNQGAAVFTFGNPQGLRFTVTSGVVSAITTTDELNKFAASSGGYFGYPGNATWIQTDASIDQGNSGGPLLDQQGTVLGLSTFCFKDK